MTTKFTITYIFILGLIGCTLLPHIALGEDDDEIFTFVRLKYSGRGWYGGSWAVDWPYSDRNFIRQLGHATNINVAPEEKIIEVDDPELLQYPFAYMLEVGSLILSDEEAQALRHYLLRGGFILIDDFHGGYEWNNFYLEFKKIFPDREPKELTIEHPIFHCLFDFKELPQIPGIGSIFRGVTYERGDGYPAHCYGVFDDNGRLMMMINHNTDWGDAWEHSADPRYPRQYSDLAYKLGINAVIYSLTH